MNTIVCNPSTQLYHAFQASEMHAGFIKQSDYQLASVRRAYSECCISRFLSVTAIAVNCEGGWGKTNGYSYRTRKEVDNRAKRFVA
jgi:hypothetical protein